VALHHQHLTAVDDHGCGPLLGSSVGRRKSAEPDLAQDPPEAVVQAGHCPSVVASITTHEQATAVPSPRE
jgi:hypothetical protein